MNPPPLARQANGPSAPGLPNTPSSLPAMSTPNQLSRQAASPRPRRAPAADTATPRSSRLRQEVFTADSPDGIEDEEDEEEMDVDDK